MPKHIEIFLPDGDHRGTRIATLANRTYVVVYIPRPFLTSSDLKPVIRDNTSKVGAYVLIGRRNGAGKMDIYIGESENCLNRIRQHDSEKDFWDMAVIITSKSDSITKAHVKYLEWMLCEKARHVGRCHLFNAVTPNRPYVTDGMNAELLDGFETVSCLISVLGFQFLETEITEVIKAPKLPVPQNRGSEIPVASPSRKMDTIDHIESLLRSEKYARIYQYQEKRRTKKRITVIATCPPWENSEIFTPRTLEEHDITKLTMELRKNGCQNATFNNVGRLVRMIAGETEFRLDGVTIVDDPDRLLQALSTSLIRVPSIQRDVTLGSLVVRAMGKGDDDFITAESAKQILRNYSINARIEGVDFGVKNRNIQRMLRETEWGLSYGRILKDYPGAKVMKNAYFGPGDRGRAVRVPSSYFLEGGNEQPGYQGSLDDKANEAEKTTGSE